MQRIRSLSRIAVILSVLGAALVVLGVVSLFVQKDSGSGFSGANLLVEQGVLLTATAVIGSLAASGLKALAARIDALERRLKESDGEQEALRESLRARVGKLERDLDEQRPASGIQPRP